MVSWSSISFGPIPAIDFPEIRSAPKFLHTSGFKPPALTASDFELPASEFSKATLRVSLDDLDAIAVDVDPETGIALFAGSENIIGTDDRKPIESSSQWPFAPVCRLILSFPKGTGSATGTLISKNVILTAGHNLFAIKYGGWPISVQAIPGSHNAERPFGVISAAKILVLEEWTNNTGHFPGSNFDLGLIILDDAIGEQAGYFGLTAAGDDDLLGKDVIVSGYPGDLDNGKVHYGHMDNITRVADRRVGYLVDTERGQSGSPVYDLVMDNGTRMPHLFGVHTTSYASLNSAMRLTTALLESIANIS